MAMSAGNVQSERENKKKKNFRSAKVCLIISW